MSIKKIIPLVMVSAIVSSAALVAAVDAVKDPQSEYAQAVKTYITSASDNMHAIREAVDEPLKSATNEIKARYEKVYAGLDQCDKLLAELKNAVPADFDRVKAEFERVRAKTLKEIESVNKG